MVLYTDAGWNKKWGLFVVTNDFGKIFGYKVFPNKLKNPKFDQLELLAIISAIEILKLRSKRTKRPDTILSDSQAAIGLLLNGSTSIKHKFSLALIAQGQRLFKEHPCNLVWIPRQVNVAGKMVAKLQRHPKRLREGRIREVFGDLRKKGVLI